MSISTHYVWQRADFHACRNLLSHKKKQRDLNSEAIYSKTYLSMGGLYTATRHTFLSPVSLSSINTEWVK